MNKNNINLKRSRKIYLKAFFMLASMAYTNALSAAPLPFINYGAVKDSPTSSWASKPWTSKAIFGSNSAVIDRSLADAASFNEVIKRYKALAANQPADSQAQYDCGYAINQALLHGYPVEGVEFLFATIAFRKADPLDSYQYTRLRFLLDEQLAWNNNQDPIYLAHVGARLLQYSPKDDRVRSQYINCFLYGKNYTSVGVANAKTWVQDSPQFWASHARLAFAEQQTWNWSKDTDVTAAQAAISEYQTTLKLIPAGNNNIPYINRMISLMQTELNGKT